MILNILSNWSNSFVNSNFQWDFICCLSKYWESQSFPQTSHTIWDFACLFKSFFIKKTSPHLSQTNSFSWILICSLRCFMSQKEELHSSQLNILAASTRLCFFFMWAFNVQLFLYIAPHSEQGKDSTSWIPSESPSSWSWSSSSGHRSSWLSSKNESVKIKKYFHVQTNLSILEDLAQYPFVLSKAPSAKVILDLQHFVASLPSGGCGDQRWQWRRTKTDSHSWISLRWIC